MAQRKPFFERLRRLDEQFRRFQEMTLTRLQGIAENYNISYNIDARFQQLADQYHNISSVLSTFQETAGNDLNSLKFWTKKLQKKTERLDSKVSALERALEENGKRPQEDGQEQGLKLSNLTQEVQDHRERIRTILVDRDEVRGGLRGLRESLEKQEAKMVQLEEQVRGALQGNTLPVGASSSPGGPEDVLTSNRTPQDLAPVALGSGRRQEHRSPKTSAKLQLKHSKRKRVKDSLLGPGPTQAPRQTQAWLEPQREDEPQLHPQEEPIELQNLPQFHPQEEPKEQWDLPQPHPQAELREPLDLPQLPLRHKIPRQHHASKKAGSICNVKSMLLFPSASTQNYVSFTKGFPVRLLELSVCTWLKVEAGYVGTLLSYATEDNDNKLVLYGRNSSQRGSVDFVIGDPAYRELPVAALLDGLWHHLCVVWSSIEGRYWHYTDRRLTSAGSKFQKGYEIPAGGAVVLGQEQDSVGGGFDEAESFVGRLAGFAVWDRALSPGEVSGVATGRGLPRGTVLTLDDVGQLNGDVQLVDCECLEHCH
ncbi:pentraxin-4 [Megalops cyprinoides]|uniref:pentraxin-4 n=1 Tax=Megalops cyprinoides TaxID=118141 RepID=UPI001863BA24|nr:pentraxin-4 [Megalops cyprinoides]